MSEMYKLKRALGDQIMIVTDILFRYTEDEAGQSQKEKFKSMTWEDMISLLTTTMLNCASWEDFETDLVINFDYNNY